ncbi:sensor histidine kinase [Micromonospora sp. NPDC006431]|uniref:sensor histidine kinase n=1 Tax=Micromonospora sp. NPDC006431 TaxID=3364235 RepID=UPI0036B4D644
MPVRSAGKAMYRRDLMASTWPWRATAYLLSGLPVGVVVLAVLATLIVLGVVSAVALVGVPLLVAATLVGLPVGAVERRRLWLVDAEPIADPHQVPERPGLRAWLRQRYREPATWRELGYTVLLATLLWPLDLLVVGCALGVPGSLLTAPAAQALGGDGEVKLLKAILLTSPAAAWAAVPIGVVLLVPAAYLVTGYGAARAALARALLAPRDNELVRRVQDLTRSRARLVDAFDAERRRIERDLHDGAQQRLVALGITLGLARLATPAEVPALMQRAHDQANLALEELRDLIRDIHPRILTDRGLLAAVAELADRSPIPVEVDVALPTRPPSAVETAAYFVVCEALANAAKHSGATRIQVSGRMQADRLVVEVGDDGCGGADAARGSGLTGLADRIAVVAGRLTLTSPPGGPTLLRVELPCHRTSRSESSSPRTVS